MSRGPDSSYERRLREEPEAENGFESLLLSFMNKEVLDLRKMNIGCKQATRIALELATNTTWKRIILAQNRIGYDGVVALTNALATTNKSVTELDLSENFVGRKGVKALARFLSDNDSSESLSLDVIADLKDTSLTSLCGASTTNTTLTSLSLRSNYISAEGAAILAIALKENATLTSLDLTENRIGDKGAVMLADALLHNSTLEGLDLRENGVGIEGVTALLNTLTFYNTSLKFYPQDRADLVLDDLDLMLCANRAGTRLIHAEGYLDLSSKVVPPYEATESLFVKELADNKTLTSLRLCGHWSILRALVGNSTLKSIWFDHVISDTGSVALVAQALRTNTCLQHLGLAGNEIGDVGIAGLVDALQTNSTLESLDLRDNHITDAGAAAILKVLKEHNFTLKWLLLQENTETSPNLRRTNDFVVYRIFTLTWLCRQTSTEISPALLQAIDFVVSSRPALSRFVNNLHQPLGKLMPLAIQAANQSSMAAIDPIFLLVRKSACPPPTEDNPDDGETSGLLTKWDASCHYWVFFCVVVSAVTLLACGHIFAELAMLYMPWLFPLATLCSSDDAIVVD
jgi:Ran GTPase-activating protein (RanGAP) involved in mRNA processing and transport